MTQKLIDIVCLSHMRNADVAHTLGRIVRVTDAITVARVLADALALRLAVEAFDLLLRQQTSSPITGDLKPLERERDSLITDLIRAVHRAMESTDAAIRAAGNELNTTLKTYAHVREEPQDTQTKVVTEMLADLTSPDKTAFLSMILSAKIAAGQLDAANREFERLYDERMAEFEKHDLGGTQRARDAADAAYRTAMLTVNSCAVYLADGSLDQPIADINAILADAEHLVHRRAGQRHRDGGGGSAEGGEPLEVNNE